MDMSENFTLSELCKSSTALRHGIRNDPNSDQMLAMVYVAENILQPVRDHYGVPFIPSSGFRCLKLNRLIGSKDNSQHTKGEAVDFEVPGVANFELATWIMNNLKFDQLILEFWKDSDPHAGWVHCSYKKQGNRNEILTIGSGGTKHGLGG